MRKRSREEIFALGKPIKLDNPIRPDHYITNGIEAKDVLNAWFPTDPLLWNCGKYLSRAGRKSGLLEDLLKAWQYLDWAIEREQTTEKETEE